jgi:hypothetical protein
VERLRLLGDKISLLGGGGKMQIRMDSHYAYASMLRCHVCVDVCMHVCMRCCARVYTCMHVALSLNARLN